MIVLSMLRQAFCISTIFDTMKIKLSHEFNFSLLFGIKVLRHNNESRENAKYACVLYVLQYIVVCKTLSRTRYLEILSSCKKASGNLLQIIVNIHALKAERVLKREGSFI